MSERYYETTDNHDKRTNSLNKPFIHRDDQRYIQLNSADLDIAKSLRLLPPLAKKVGCCPVIVLIGDIGNVDNEKFTTLRRFYLDGVLSAAFKSGAVIVDSGQSTSIGVGGNFICLIL